MNVVRCDRRGCGAERPLREWIRIELKWPTVHSQDYCSWMCVAMIADWKLAVEVDYQRRLAEYRAAEEAEEAARRAQVEPISL
ncbi:MAG: hypothetical protein WB777_14150 [Mycobacterium sp.]